MLASLVEVTDTKKKNYAFNMIKDIPFITSISITKIHDTKIVTTFFSNEKSTKIRISENCKDHFVDVSSFSKNASTDTFYVKLINVSLNINKLIFEAFLSQIGVVTFI